MDYVDNFGSIIAFVMLTGAFQCFLAAAWVVIGGLGGQWRVNQALARQAEELAHLSQRVTREQKVRAGEKRQESVREEAHEAKSLAVDAAERLAAAAPPLPLSGAGPGQRPSTMHLINGAK